MPGTTTNLALRYPLPTEAPDGPGGIQNLANDIEDRFGRRATSAAGLFYGQRAMVSGIEYRWNGSAWVAWDSEFQAFTPIWQYLGNGVPGAGQYKYTNGKVRFEAAVQATAASSGVVTCSMPVAARHTPLYSGGPTSQTGWWATGRGNLYNGNDADLVLALNNDNLLRFGLVNSSRLIDTLGGGFQVGSGNSIRFVIEYDQA